MQRIRGVNIVAPNAGLGRGPRGDSLWWYEGVPHGEQLYNIPHGRFRKGTTSLTPLFATLTPRGRPNRITMD